MVSHLSSWENSSEPVSGGGIQAKDLSFRGTAGLSAVPMLFNFFVSDFPAFAQLFASYIDDFNLC